MKKALKILATLLISLLSIIGLMTVIIGIFYGGIKDYAIGHIDRVTNEEPFEYEIDKIEVYLLMQPEGQESSGTFQANRYSKAIPTYGSVSIEGKEAEEIVELWSITPKSFHERGLCFEPPYGLKMYSKGELKFQGAICWHCHRFQSYNIPFYGDSGFPGDSRAAQKMLELIDAKLPYPKKSGPPAEELSPDKE